MVYIIMNWEDKDFSHQLHSPLRQTNVQLYFATKLKNIIFPAGEYEMVS